MRSIFGLSSRLVTQNSHIAPFWMLSPGLGERSSAAQMDTEKVTKARYEAVLVTAVLVTLC
jgi:hypothetical protein